MAHVIALLISGAAAYTDSQNCYCRSIKMFFRFMATTLGAIVLLSACTTQPFNSMSAHNQASFVTTGYESTQIPQDVLRRAAAITLRQNYTHFTLTRDNSNDTQNRPAITVDYGRSPYGFTDAAQTGPASLKAGISLLRPKTRWIVHMMSWPDSRQLQIYDARLVLAKASRNRSVGARNSL